MRRTNKIQRQLDLAIQKKEIDPATAKQVRAKLEEDQTNTINAFNMIYLRAIKQPIRP